MRSPKPWYRVSKNAWYVDQSGKKIRLGIHPEGAPAPKKTKAGWNAPPSIMDAFYRLMASDPAYLPQSDKLTVAVLCDLFLDHSKKQHAPRTYENYRLFLQSFCDVQGRAIAEEIKPFHVNRWIDAHPTWKGARRHAIIATKRVFSWAEQQGLLAHSPVRTIKVERANRRTRVLSAEEQTEILAAINDEPFRQFVRTMLATGCRPSEISSVTAEMVNLDHGVWVLDKHKTAKKTLRPRVIYLTPELLELTKTLMVKYPEGPLFRSSRKRKPYTRNAIRIRFQRLREKLPHLKHFVAYSARHTYATQALVNGVGIAQVAELLGHTSTEMVSSTYGHLAGQVNHMREAAMKAAT